MKRSLVFSILSACIFLSLLLFSQERSQDRDKIIKFSHKKHIAEYGVECALCHEKVNESTQASDNLLTSKEECAACHDVEDEENCTLCHFEDKETWQRFDNPERGIVFNHKIHLERADQDCNICHKNLEKVDFASAENLPTIRQCASCHNNQKSTLECVNCHINPLNLRPDDHTADFLVAHSSLARLDDDDCAICHTPSDCVECHEPGTLFTTNSGAGSSVQAPLSISPNGTRSLVLMRVHQLNFRVTHGLQAVGRTQDCVVCHETQNFCQTCHESEGVEVAGKPLWHGGSDWGALAGVVGSGGGRHGELARRDIESCASCHSTEGNDPTCLLCHTDFDGIRGTDARTHETGFANRFGEGSSFHDDESAVCYSCHTPTAQGIGFCGYCHQ